MEGLFRDELLDWLADNLTDEYRAAGRIASAGDDAHFELRLEWEKKLAAGGWSSVGLQARIQDSSNLRTIGFVSL
ncbi:MAG: hypothetical protein ACRDY7_12805 [Acidimicrobiia bacterium]